MKANVAERRATESESRTLVALEDVKKERDNKELALIEATKQKAIAEKQKQETELKSYHMVCSRLTTRWKQANLMLRNEPLNRSLNISANGNGNG